MFERAVSRWFRQIIMIAVAVVMVGSIVWLIHSRLAAVQTASYDETNLAAPSVSHNITR